MSHHFEESGSALPSRSKMMDPSQHRTTDDDRDFSRKLRDTRKQQERPAATTQKEENAAADYRELFDFAPDAYLITDVHGTIREANLAAGNLLGVESRVLAGKPLPSFFDDKGRKEYRHQLDRICDFDRLDDWEIALHAQSGERVAVSVSIARASKKEKGAGGYRWILRDISKRVRAEEGLRELNRELEQRVVARTAQLAAANRTKDELLLSERKAREEAEAANRANADFLALLSHKFRTPLQAIFGYTELLERQIHGPLNEAQMRDLHRIRQSQQHLLGLISTVLDFARLESGQEVEAHVSPTVIHEVLSEMAGFIGPQLAMRELKYHNHCSDEKLSALADPAKVQQIVLNLLSNALKFTPPGGHIALGCEREKDLVAIRVADTGIGIPEDKLESIFEPFVQLRGSNPDEEGTGLGLPISRRLAAAMGGTLTASCNSGKGATFTLRLPLAP
jgi:PAS domain S-box-containing protein